MLFQYTIICVLSTALGAKRSEDAIPVVEIRGEGKPMSAAQIRHLEEMSNGGPLDIKVDKTWVPHESKCTIKAKRKDFVKFHYKVMTEEGKRASQTYGGEPVTMQLGVGMTMPGLDKGLQGMCAEELRKIQVPYRLSRKNKSKMWKAIPNDEHWLTFSVEMLEVDPYTHEKQFRFMDTDESGSITQEELVKWSEAMKKSWGKQWKNDAIDNVLAAKYYIKYFDVNGDGKVNLSEFTTIMERDEKAMAGVSKKPEGRRRDPGFAWILDFNNDGVVTVQENIAADEILGKEPKLLPTGNKDEL